MEAGGTSKCSVIEGSVEGGGDLLLLGEDRRYGGVNRPVEGGRRDLVGRGSPSLRLSVSTLEVGSSTSSNLPSDSSSRASWSSLSSFSSPSVHPRRKPS